MATPNFNEFEIEVKEWVHEKDFHKYLNIPQQNKDLQYGIFITPYSHLEPDIYYFYIGITKEITNPVLNPSFKAVTESKFKSFIAKDIVPTEKLIFDFILKAGYDFNKEYTKRVAGTDLSLRQLRPPVFEELDKQIQEYLNHWDKHERYKDLN